MGRGWPAGSTDAALGDELSAIPYSSSITVNLVFDEAQLGRLPDGFGFLVPAVEGRAMLACTFVHRKFVGRTPTGKAVLRAFLGGAKDESLLDQSDEVLVATVRRELSEILGAARGRSAYSGGSDAGFALAASHGAVLGRTPGTDEADQGNGGRSAGPAAGRECV